MASAGNGIYVQFESEPEFDLKFEKWTRHQQQHQQS